MELSDGDLLLRPGRRRTSTPWSPAATTRTSRTGFRRFRTVHTQPDALAFIGGVVRGDQDAMAIELSGEVVCGIGLGVNAHGYRGVIGYWVGGSKRRVVCARAPRLLARHALEELELQRLQLVTDPDNLVSQRVAEKVGFRRAGVLRAHLRHPDGRIRDSVVYSLLSSELRD